MTKQERIARAPAAIAERIERARQAPLTVTVKTDKVFVVANGDGHAYEVAFAQTPLGACTCEDFATRGGLLAMCKHTAAVVLSQWPDNFDRWEARVRDASAAALAALPADPEPEPTAAAAPVAADLVAAVVAAALPIVMEALLDALAASAEAITAKTAAVLAAAQ